MSWKDYGLIFRVTDISYWIKSHAYVPTAVKLADKIRIFIAFLDDSRIGRLGYIDVSCNDPNKVLKHSLEPLIKDSSIECFDGSGITPMSIIKEKNHIKLYYAGWKLVENEDLPYQLFMGLLIGDSSGENFSRYSAKPIFPGRSRFENIRTGIVIKEVNGYRSYLATQQDSHSKFGKQLPIYNLETSFSKNGLDWPNEQKTVFEHQNENILGFGRSAVWKNKSGLYEGLFSIRQWDGLYSKILYSSSVDGVSWKGLGEEDKAFLPSMTCDNQKQVSFPTIIMSEENILMFYNGNSFGQEGLRLAVWSE